MPYIYFNIWRFYFLDPGSTKPPLRFKSTTTRQPTSTTRYTSLSDPLSIEVAKHESPHQEYHLQQKRSNTKFFITDKEYTPSDPVYSSNWTFPWDAVSKSTLSNNHHPISKSLVEGNNGLLLDDDSILKQLVEETKTPVVFLSENNTAINAHSGTSVTLPCIIKKESKFEVVSLK